MFVSFPWFPTSPWSPFLKLGHVDCLAFKRPISAEVALPRLQSKIKVALFLFASHSFLENNLRFMVKLIVKSIVINGKIHKNKRKRFYSSNKEGLICWYRSITANFYKFVLMKFQVNIKSQILKYTNTRFLYQIGRWIVLYSNYFHKTWVIYSYVSFHWLQLIWQSALP
jgi:hypothetical protein